MPNVVGPSFRVAGIEPAEVRASDPATRKAYWSAVLAFTLEAKDKELRANLDRFGRPMHPLALSTIRNRHSAMGPADPGAPPLQPAHGLSRTRSLLTGQATASGVVCWWLFDSHTDASWGDILGYHRSGSHRLPRRDVIGLSPRSRAEVAAKAAKWWTAFKTGREGVPRSRSEVYPGGKKPPFLVERVPGAKRGVSELKINGKHYTFQSGNASQVREGIANKTFSGWHSAAEVAAQLKAQGVTKSADGRYHFGPKPGGPPPPTFGGGLPKKPKPTPKPPAKPAAPKANGKISYFLKVDRAFAEREATAVENSIKAINAVHSVPTLSTIPVDRMSREYIRENQGTQGYFRRKVDQADSIAIRENTDFPHITTLHEIGHFVDWSAVPRLPEHEIKHPDKATIRDFTASPETAEWWRVVQASRSHQGNLAVEAKAEVEFASEDGRTYTWNVDTTWVEYLNSPNEVWARAYAQYIASKSNDEIIQHEITVKSAKVEFGHVRTQWTAEDFKPIAAAFDALFRKLGWLK